MSMKINPSHEAANAFWKYWKEYGETHKHGYYEATWGAINHALLYGAHGPHDSDALYLAAKKAREFLKKHHWRFCPPGDKWPEGSWDLDAAKEAFDALEAVLSPNAVFSGTLTGGSAGKQGYTENGGNND